MGGSVARLVGPGVTGSIDTLAVDAFVVGGIDDGVAAKADDVALRNTQGGVVR